MGKRAYAVWVWLCDSLVWFVSQIHPGALVARFRHRQADEIIDMSEGDTAREPKEVDLGSARVIVAGRETRSGRVLRVFAQDLAKMLGLECVVLWGARECELRDFAFQPGDILVAHKVVRKDVHTLVPFDELGLLSRGHAPRVLIPLSNDESGRYATQMALPHIAKLGFGVVLWHTTWRDPNNSSTSARDHMCVEAKVTIPQVERMVEAMGLRYETHVVMAESIEYGAVEAALDLDCSLIIMARGLLTGRGSYADSVLTKSPVPVLVMGRNRIHVAERRVCSDIVEEVAS